MADKMKGLIDHNTNLNMQVTQYLREALILLLERKSYQSITVTELCEKAGVSRMAFYGNYKTKEDLFEEIVRYINKDLVNAVGNPFTSDTNLSWYQNFFTLMSENAETVKSIVIADRSRYVNTINEVVLHSRALSEEQKYLRLIWTGALVNITLYWIESGMKQSVEDVAKLCYDAMGSALSNYPTVQF